ncbi:hypothetical protein TSUD_65170 [Trifolium subterraneum]|uniref:F-box domain-containing protein n=1 Tax=Trifolium subterraneum TaxID=3900 RepID=A0A2Z6MXD0_TRISU|nr:hypothetical protein TSUD_65170 [Trifolium subterraneum]
MSSLAHEKMIPPDNKRARHDNNEENEDRLSDLPECVLLHILSFLNSKHAVQTCVLSPKWKHLWKRIPSLILHSSEFSTAKKLAFFVTKILNLRDTTPSLHTLDFERMCSFEPQWTLNEIVNYACSHATRLKQLAICVKGDSSLIFPRISSCRALTSLKLCVYYNGETTLFPKSLNLPALTRLDLTNFAFCASDNADHAEPFSSFNSLNNLIISNCTVKDGPILRISSATLVNLTMSDNSSDFTKIELFAPSLDTITFDGIPYQTLCGSCLSSVKQVSIDADIYSRVGELSLILLSWLHDLDNIKSLTVTSSTLQILSLVPDLFKVKLPSMLCNLKTLKVKLKPLPFLLHLFKNESHKEAHKMHKARTEPFLTIPEGIVNFLLQNSPSAEVHIRDYTEST